MNCPDHEAITDFLLARAAGSVDAKGGAAMADHLRACLKCKAEAAEWERIVDTLGQVLSESPEESPERCLDENELSEYLDGISGGLDRTRIERHLGGCRRCAQNLVSLHELVRALNGEEPIYSFALRRLKQGLEIVQSSLKNVIVAPLTPEPVLSALSSASQAVTCAIHHEGFTVTVTIQPNEADSFTCVLHTGEKRFERAIVSLSRQGMLLESRTLPDFNATHFDGLSPAAYRLELDVTGISIPIDFVVLREGE